MSQNHRTPDTDSIVDEAWGHVVGGMNWLRSVLFGEFVDNRPLSAVVVDMLVSFVPGVVIVTSARDAIAVILRLANHPEKREELMEWVLLCACLITIALPIAMAAGGAVAAGVGAVVGGIAGSELGAGLRAVMLMLIKNAQKLVELIQFLQKFIKGDVLKFLRAVKFIQYEKPLLQALTKITGKLVDIVRSLRTHFEGLRHFHVVKDSIAKLVEWERKFYDVQQDALRQIPKALLELDARLATVLTETAPREAHTVSAGIKVGGERIATPPKQRVRDTPGKLLSKLDDTDPRSDASFTGVASYGQSSTSPPAAILKTPPSDKPDVGKLPETHGNTRKQTAADAAAAADRTRITQLSEEARLAAKRGDMGLARMKISEAQGILRPYLPRKNSDDSWDEVIKRLDVSSPKDKAVFWSGDPKAAKEFAESIGGVALETTSGGNVIDNWSDLKDYNWNGANGDPPYARDLWAGVSKKYAEAASGNINVLQTTEKLSSTNTLWHNVEKIVLRDKMVTGEINSIKIHEIDVHGEVRVLGKEKIQELLGFKGGV